MSDEQNMEQSPSDETLNTEKTVPYNRFSQVNSEKKALEDRLAKIEAESRAKEAEALAKQGEYKTLYEQTLAEVEPLRQAKQELESQRARLEQRNKDRLALIPEDKRALIPEIDDPLKMEAWLDRSLSLITEQQKPPAPRGDGGARGNTQPASVKLSSEELEFAKMAGISPERYALQKARRGEAIDIESLKKKKE